MSNFSQDGARGRKLGLAVDRAGERRRFMDEKQRRAKKQWKASEKSAARAKFPLPDDQLEELFDAVATAIDHKGCDHSLRATTAWLQNKGHDIQTVVGWLQDNGGFCDCEVVWNARDHWEENRE